MALNRLEPIGEPSEASAQADYWRAALIASTIANVNSTKRTFHIADFMPDLHPDPPTQEKLQVKIDTAMEAFAAAFTAKGGSKTAEQKPKGGD